MSMTNAPRKSFILLGKNASAFPGLMGNGAVADDSDLIFLDDAEKAISFLSQSPVDGLVVDDTLNNEDGDAFFGKVRALRPDIALMFTRDSAAEAPVRMSTYGIAPLPSSCDAEILAAMAERAHSLTLTLACPEIRAVVGNLDNLPTLPKTYHAINRAAADPDSSLADIARIIETDPVMTIKILQLVNSAFFGRRQKTSSISHAVSFLGVEMLKSLVLSAHVFGAMGNSKVRGFSLEAFQNYSIRTARCAQRFMTERRLADEAFTAGIVHDIGKMILALRKPADFEAIITEAAQSGEAQHVLEHERFGVTHAEVGAYLLSTWGIPWSVVESVAFHHQPSRVANLAGGCDVLAAVHAADALLGMQEDGAPANMLDLDFLEYAGLIARLPRWQEIVDEDSGA